MSKQVDARKGRNKAMLWALVAMCAIFYILAMVKISQGIIR
jgi:hypothetical protein